MRPIASARWFRALAVTAPLMAVAPVVLGLHGGWVALHLIGGGLSLAILVYCAYLLPSPWRWYAAAGVIISIAAISVVTGGGTIGPAIQVAMLCVLAAIYVACVFWRHGDPRP